MMLQQLYIGLAIFFFIVQLVTVFISYRKWLRGGSDFMPATIKLEFAAILISLASFGFFLFRTLPIWKNDMQCLMLHGAVMFLFELQLGLYTAIQYLRFIHPLGFDLRFAEVVLALMICVSVGISTYGQTGFVGESGMCDFTHNILITVINACLHITTEFVIIYYFSSYYDKLQTILGNFVWVKDLIRRMQLLLVVFCVWLVGVSASNAMTHNMIGITVVYNIHFTLIAFIIGAPHLFANGHTGKTPEQTSGPNTSKRAKGVVSKTGQTSSVVSGSGNTGDTNV